MKCSILIHRSDGCTRAFVFYTRDEDELENDAHIPPPRPKNRGHRTLDPTLGLGGLGHSENTICYT